LNLELGPEGPSGSEESPDGSSLSMLRSGLDLEVEGVASWSSPSTVMGLSLGVEVGMMGSTRESSSEMVSSLAASWSRLSMFHEGERGADSNANDFWLSMVGDGSDDEVNLGE